MRSTTHPAGLIARTSARRAAKRRTLSLERELAGFHTASDRLELDTLIDTLPADGTREVRSILAKQRV